MRAAIELFCIAAVNQGRFRWLTTPLSYGYAWGVKGRNWLYDRLSWISKAGPLPVVSVGNLVMGGVGKTQVVLLLARTLDIPLAILSRGVGGRVTKGDAPLRVLPDKHTAALSGDEPWLLASALPHAMVWVHPSRYKSLVEAKQAGAALALLDDGMQHRQLRRNLELVVLSGENPLGGGHFFPRGWLREEVARLRQADYILFVGAPSAETRQAVAEVTAAPYAVTQVGIEKICLTTGEKLPSLKGCKVGLFAGIGNPNRFAETVAAAGAQIVDTCYLPDHKRIREQELEEFAILCKQKGADYLLCTEKDYVKLPSAARACALPIGYLVVSLQVTECHAVWEELLKTIYHIAGR